MSSLGSRPPSDSAPPPRRLPTAGRLDERCREQGRPASNPQSAKLAHRSPVLLLNPDGRDPLVDAGTSRASGATASSQGVCSLLEERIPALAAMINRDIPGEARLGQLP